MTQSNQQRIDEIVGRAIELPVGERARFVEREYASESEAVLEKVNERLAAYDNSETTPLEDSPELQGAYAAQLHGRHSFSGQSLLGKSLGPYEIKRQIGSGGFGSVYLGLRTSDYTQKVAIKVLRDDFSEENVVARFELERQVLADFHHEHICRLIDGGSTDDRRPYLVMEYIEGESLTDYCNAPGREVSLSDRLRLFQSICRAIAYAHSFGVIHRDVKPANILVSSEGVPKLLDFGIAKLIDRRSRQRDLTLTEFGRPMTPRYASPEQLRGEAISTATDVYSLGVVLFELLTGKLPYEFKSRQARDIEFAICEAEPRKPSDVSQAAETRRDQGVDETKEGSESSISRRVPQFGKQLRGDLDNIILAALRKEPRRRYQSANELADDIENFFENRPVVARRDSAVYRFQKYVRRHRFGTAAACAILLATLIGIGGLIWGWRDSHESYLVSEQAKKRADENLADALEAVREMLVQTGAIRLQSDPHLQGIRTELLEQASAMLVRIAERNQTDVSRERADTLLLLSAVQRSLGDLDEALASASQAQEIINQIEPDGGSVEELRAGCYLEMGASRRALEQFDDAIGDLSMAIAILQLLLDDDRIEEELEVRLRENLIESAVQLGWIHVNNVTDPSRVEELAGLAIEQYSLLQKRRGDFHYHSDATIREVVDAHIQLSNAQFDTKRHEESEAEHLLSISLANEVRDDVGRSVSKSVALKSYAYFLGFHARFDEAADQLLKAIEELDPIVEQFPSIYHYADELAGMHHNLVWTRRQQGLNAAAEKHVRASVEIYSRLRADFPENRTFFERLNGTRTELAWLLQAQDKKEEAEVVIKGILEAFEQQYQKDPNNANSCYYLGGALSNMASIIRSQGPGRRSECRDYLERAISVQLKARELDSDLQGAWENLSNHYLMLGRIEKDVDNVEAARTAYEHAIQVTREMVAKFSLEHHRQSLGGIFAEYAMFIAEHDANVALELAKEARQFSPGSTLTMLAEGWGLFYDEQWSSALELIEQALARGAKEESEPSGTSVAGHLMIVISLVELERVEDAAGVMVKVDQALPQIDEEDREELQDLLARANQAIGGQ